MQARGVTNGAATASAGEGRHEAPPVSTCPPARATSPPLAPPPATKEATAEEKAARALDERQTRLEALRQDTRVLLARRLEAVAWVDALEAQLRQAEQALLEASNAEDFEAAEARGPTRQLLPF